MKTVGEVSKMVGVSVRTLHYYDEIGLVPTKRADSGYRLYSDEDISRLREIVRYRKLDIPLEEIGLILDNPDCDRRKILEKHLEKLDSKREEIEEKMSMVNKLLSQ